MAIADTVAARLNANASILAVVTGGIWTRSLRREGPGSTPTAYSITPPYQIKTSIVVLDRVSSPDDFGPGDAFIGTTEIHLYAQAHASGRSSIDNAVDLIMKDLGGAWITERTFGVELRIGGRDGIADAVDMMGAVSDTVVFRHAGIWSLT